MPISINNRIFVTKRDAENVMHYLNELIQHCGRATLLDYYNLCGDTSNFMDNLYGWTDIRNASIGLTRKGYVLSLPEPTQLIEYSKIGLSPSEPQHKEPEVVNVDMGSDRNDVTVLTISNIDTYIGNHTLLPKEVQRKSYIDKIGQTIDFCGVQKTINSVKITKEYIIVELILP